MTKKDAYTSFKGKYLYEEEFRRYWGNREEIMIDAMVANRKLAEMTKDPAEKKKFEDEADKLYIKCNILGDVFMSLEAFRVGNEERREGMLV